MEHHTFEFRVCMGMQCPECQGVRIECRLDVTGRIAAGSWLCQECGCQWDRNYYPNREEVS